jgi:hypothetical protein
MMQVVMGVAGGKMRLETVERMLHPDNTALWPNLNMMPSTGLTLAEIQVLHLTNCLVPLITNISVWGLGPILPNTIFQILHIFVRFSHRYV